MSAKRTFLASVLIIAAGCSAGHPLPLQGQQDPGMLVFNGYTASKIDCYRCHNGNGHGTGRGPNLADAVPNLDDPKLLKVINGGALFMPGYEGKMTVAEQHDLVAWLRKEFGGPPATSSR